MCKSSLSQAPLYLQAAVQCQCHAQPKCKMVLPNLQQSGGATQISSRSPDNERKDWQQPRQQQKSHESSGEGQNSEASTSGSGPEYWQDLLGVPEPDMFGNRARSASDAAVLRRKGHLKEQDLMIEFMLRMHETHTSLEVMQKMEKWIAEHQKVGMFTVWTRNKIKPCSRLLYPSSLLIRFSALALISTRRLISTAHYRQSKMLLF